MNIQYIFEPDVSISKRMNDFCLGAHHLCVGYKLAEVRLSSKTAWAVESKSKACLLGMLVRLHNTGSGLVKTLPG